MYACTCIVLRFYFKRHTWRPVHFANNARTMYYVMDAVYVHCTSVEKPCFHQRQQQQFDRNLKQAPKRKHNQKLKYNDHLTLKSRQASIRSEVSPPRISLYLKSSASFQCNLNVCVVAAHRLIRQDPDLQRALSDAKRNLLLPVVCPLKAYLSRQFTERAWSFWSRGGFAPTQAQR